MVVAKSRQWGKWGDVGQISNYKLSSGELMYSMVTIVYNTVLYT